MADVVPFGRLIRIASGGGWVGRFRISNRRMGASSPASSVLSERPSFILRSPYLKRLRNLGMGMGPPPSQSNHPPWVRTRGDPPFGNRPFSPHPYLDRQDSEILAKSQSPDTVGAEGNAPIWEIRRAAPYQYMDFFARWDPPNPSWDRRCTIGDS